MDIEQARQIVDDYSNHNIPKLRRAIDCLLGCCDNYRAIARQVEPSASTIRKYHRIGQLPKGVLWQLQKGNLPLGMAHQISRLDSIDDQWFLAFYVVDLRDESFTVADCRDVVNRVKDSQLAVRQVLAELTGETFDATQPLVLPVSFDFRLRLARAGWQRQLPWEDLCYAVVRGWLNKQGALKKAEKIPKVMTYVESVIEELKSWDV